MTRSPGFTCGRFFTFSPATKLNTRPSLSLSVTSRVFWSTFTTVAVAVTSAAMASIFCTFSGF